jgi:hypothetical protein
VIDPLREVVEEAHRCLDVGFGLCTTIGGEPVAGSDALEPRADLVEVGFEFLGLGGRQVVSEDLELDLLGELRPALFGDLGVLLAAQVVPSRAKPPPNVVGEVDQTETECSPPRVSIRPAISVRRRSRSATSGTATHDCCSGSAPSRRSSRQTPTRALEGCVGKR